MSAVKIDEALLDKVGGEAIRSERLRMNYDLRNTPEDNSQRMLNALEMGTVLPIHRHMHTSETIVILRGHLREDFYDDGGRLTESFDLRPGGPLFGLNIPVGQWHSFEVLEGGTVIMEAKDGKWAPLTPEELFPGPGSGTIPG